MRTKVRFYEKGLTPVRIRLFISVLTALTALSCFSDESAIREIAREEVDLAVAVAQAETEQAIERADTRLLDEAVLAIGDAYAESEAELIARMDADFERREELDDKTEDRIFTALTRQTDRVTQLMDSYVDDMNVALDEVWTRLEHDPTVDAICTLDAWVTSTGSMCI